MKWVKNVDVVMWTKNSAHFLPTVLRQIEKVIPPENIKNKIIIDDQSSDSTVEVAKKLGWTVYKNQGNGIGDAYQTALNYISADYLVSVEHDVILAPDWWSRISVYMKNSKVAVAQGVRVGTNPIIKKIDEYVIERQDEKSKLLNLSLDNTIYHMSIIRQYKINVVNGLSALYALERVGFKWIIDTTVISDHIRPSVWYLLDHDYKMQKDHIARTPTLNRRVVFLKNLALFILSPIRAMEISIKKNCPQIMIVYPLDRLVVLKAYAEPMPRR